MTPKLDTVCASSHSALPAGTLLLPKFTCLMLLTFLLLFSGCKSNSISEEFRKDAAFAYELIEAAGNGKTVLKADVEKAIAAAKADVKTTQESEAMSALESYISAYRSEDDSALAKRYLEVCRWETAKRLGRDTPYIEKPAQLGDCRNLSSLSTERFLSVYDCENADQELKDLETKLKQLNSDPSTWLRVNSRREKRQKEVTAKCVQTADQKVQSRIP